MDKKHVPEFMHDHYIALFNNYCFDNNTVFFNEISVDGTETRFTKTTGLIDYGKLVDVKKAAVSQQKGFAITLKTDKEIPFEWEDSEGITHKGSAIYPAGVHHFRLHFCNCFGLEKFTEMSEIESFTEEYNGEPMDLVFMKELLTKKEEKTNGFRL